MATFTTLVTLEIQLRVSADTEELLQNKLDELSYRIEEIIFKSYWLIKVVQQIASCDVEEEISSDGKTHIGAVKFTIACELYEAFDPLEDEPPLTEWPPKDFIPAPLEEMTITIAEPPGTPLVGLDFKFQN
jgi:hypothetical protein